VARHGTEKQNQVDNTGACGVLGASTIFYSPDQRGVSVDTTDRMPILVFVFFLSIWQDLACPTPLLGFFLFFLGRHWLCFFWFCDDQGRIAIL
jgi:hypothetical protein